MRVLIVSGIWPPDVGGPASHAPELADWLRGRGHAVEAVVTADRPPARRAYPVRWVTRALPPGLRHVAVAALIARRARRADVVYATSMLGRTAVGARLARRPYVVKVTSDPAFERARRRGLVRGTTTEFQQRPGGRAAGLLRAVRDASVGGAAHVICPSSFMRDLVVTWGVPSVRVSVVPNPAPDPSEAAPAHVEARPALVFAGRLTPAKQLDVLLAALAEVPDATLLIVGDGEERSRLEALARTLELDGRVRFLGARPRAEVLGLLGAADVAVLSSAWENFPHGAVEALAMGTPVVATAVGGLPEIVHDGENGLLVPAGDPPAFARAVRRVLDDRQLHDRLSSAAAPSVARFAVDDLYGTIERVLLEAVA